MKTYRLDMSWHEEVPRDVVLDICTAIHFALQSVERPEERTMIRPVEERRQRLIWLAPHCLPHAVVRLATQAIDNIAGEYLHGEKWLFQRSELEREIQLLVGFGDDRFIGLISASTQ